MCNICFNRHFSTFLQDQSYEQQQQQNNEGEEREEGEEGEENGDVDEEAAPYDPEQEQDQGDEYEG